MKLMRSVFMILAIFVSVLNCSDQKPKGWKDVVSFSNPFATFGPSIISKGHAQYFEEVGSLSNEQKDNLKKFANQLQFVKLATLMGSVFCCFVAWKYGLSLNSKPVSPDFPVVFPAEITFKTMLSPFWIAGGPAIVS